MDSTDRQDGSLLRLGVEQGDKMDSGIILRGCVSGRPVGQIWTLVIKGYTHGVMMEMIGSLALEMIGPRGMKKKEVKSCSHGRWQAGLRPNWVKLKPSTVLFSSSVCLCVITRAYTHTDRRS